MFVRMLAAAAAVSLVSSAASAATIAWSTPQDITSASVVATSGTLVDSATTGASVTVNGVAFNGLATSGATDTFTGSNITFTNVDTTTGIYSLPTTGDTHLNVLLGSGAYQASNRGPIGVNLSGLTVGKSYEVQFLQPYWNNNWATTFSDGNLASGAANLTGPDVTGFNGYPGAGASTLPQSVIGTFVADGTAQTIWAASPTGYAVIDAVQVRAVPEPATWAMLVLGMGAMGAVLRRRRIGGLVAA